MNVHILPHISIRNLQSLSSGFVVAGALAVIMLICIFTPLRNSPNWSIAMGAGICTILCCMIFSRLRFSKPKESAGAKSKDNKISQDKPESELDGELRANAIAETDMREMGLDTVREDDDIIFRFQGGNFRMCSLDCRIVRIVYPIIFP